MIPTATKATYCSDHCLIIYDITFAFYALEHGSETLLQRTARKWNSRMRGGRRKAEKTTQDETDNVHQELEALRRAPHGQTAGADVSIATKTKTTKKSLGSVVPLCLIGDEGAPLPFFEFYPEHAGSRYYLASGKWGCTFFTIAKSWAFCTCSLQSLPVRKSRREASESQDKSTDDNHAAIDLRGPILLCAMVELLFLHSCLLKMTSYLPS